MMLKLVDIFAYLAVVLRAGTLICQSLLLGGLLFLYWIARPSPEIPIDALARVRSLAQRMFRFAAIGLVLVQIGYLYVNSAVLMATDQIGIGGVVGANFFIAGSVMLVAGLVIAIVARPAAGCGCLLVDPIGSGGAGRVGHDQSRGGPPR